MNKPLEFDMRSFIHALPGLWRTERRAPALPWLVVGFCTLALLISCGGGGGVGSGGTGATASGTVTGFGSIIVDGVRFDDSKASVSIERSADDNSNGGSRAEVKLGHQVTFGFDGRNEGEGVARSISIEPTLIGVMTAKALDGSSITVMGREIAINTNAASGPVTVLERSLATIGNGSLVEVHAIAGGTASSGLVATRVEVTTSLALRVSGVINGLSSSGGVTSMSVAGVTVLVPTGASGATIVPAGTTLANGQNVAVFADRLGFNDVTSALTATRVRVAVRKAGTVDDYVGGVITNLNTDAKTFTLGGLTVSYKLATFSPNTATLVNNTTYVRVRGTLSSNGQQLEANKVQLRSAESEAELHGNIAGFTAAASASAPATFTLRDVVVSLPAGVTPDFTRCSGTSALVDGLFVEVKGSTTAAGVTASSVKCEDETSVGGATVERKGAVASPVGNETVGSFTLQTSSGDLKVTYSELTFFRSPLVDGKSLVKDRKVEVEGQITGTGTAAVLVATKIKQDD